MYCNGVIQLSQLSFTGCLKSSRSVMRVLYTLCCSSLFPAHFSQLDLNPANFEATVNEFCRLSLFVKTAFFNDVTITSWLRSDVHVLLIGHFTIFKLHGLSGWFVPKIVKSCLNLSILRPKYYRSLFSGHGVFINTTFASLCGGAPNKQNYLLLKTLI